MNPEELLKKLGLDERESLVYLSLLETGPQLPQHIARSTGIKRTTLYEIFPPLIDQGLVIEVTQGKRRLFQAVAPDRLLRDYENRYKEIREHFADLQAIYRMQGLRPKIEVYEGFEGMKKLYNRTLECKELIKSFVTPSRYNDKVMDWFVKEYVPARVKRGVKINVIMTADQVSEYYSQFKKEHLRESKLVSTNKFKFRIECMIQANRVYFASYEKGGPLVGIIIESKQIADTLSSLFDLAWEGADKFKKEKRKEKITLS
jgi:sugar-specific transcriptional regulator TrmB